MALLPVGIARRAALSLLRSGRAFEDDGIGAFKRMYKVSTGKSAPDEVVSEFRRLLKGIEAEAVQQRVSYNRRYNVPRRPWSEERKQKLQEVVNLQFADDEVPNAFVPIAAEDTGAYYLDRAQKAMDDAYLQRVDKRGSARLKQAASMNRASAQTVDALFKLFGTDPIKR